ncbi:PIR protein [Plasmodium ovale]|uniref:PIR protein n=1 Tax=Plasmodium ovale TaxID=36330 RepID=A0A1D3JD99_PLAOA|nr:PIR protein [Plasmodium ovale]
MDSDLVQLGAAHPFLKQLKLYQFYELMETNKTGPIATNSKCNRHLIESIPYYQEILSICRECEKILYSFKTNLNGVFKIENKDRYCNYFKYWLNDQTKEFDSNSYNMMMLPVSLIDYDMTLDKEYRCNNISDLKINKEHFEKNKKLFFHTENLHWIKDKCTNGQCLDVSSYSDYLKKSSDFYDEIICADICKNSALYKSQLELFQEEFNNTIDSFLALEKNLETEKLNSPLKHICKIKEKPTLCNLDNRETEWNAVTALDSPDVEDDLAPDTAIDGTKGMSSTIIVSIIFSFLIIISFLFFAYKFTSFGSWLNLFIQKKKRIWSNLDKETDQFLNISDNQELNSEKIYNIAYHSA